MLELARLFHEVELAVCNQEPVIEKLEGMTEEAQDQIPQAIEELNAAVNHAKTRNRTRFWVLGIIGGITAIGVIVSVIVVKVALK